MDKNVFYFYFYRFILSRWSSYIINVSSMVANVIVSTCLKMFFNIIISFLFLSRIYLYDFRKLHKLEISFKKSDCTLTCEYVFHIFFEFSKSKLKHGNFVEKLLPLHLSTLIQQTLFFVEKESK